jgi:hypothetical protein
MTVSTEGLPGSVVLAIADGASAAVSALAEGRLRYNTAFNRLEFSENASPWTPFSALAGYWSQTGTVVHPTTLTDQVAVGTSSLAGSEQFRVVGDCSLQGDIDLESGAGRTIAVTQAAADTTGNDLSLRAGDAGAMAGATFRFGGIALLQGGAGGDASGANAGSKGGRGRVYGGDGGDATGTGNSGEGGNVEIVGGQSPSPSGTGSQGNGGDVFIVGGFGDIGGETVLRGGFGNTTDGDIRIGTEQTANLNIGYNGVGGALPINLRGQPNILDPSANNFANLDFTDGDSAALSAIGHGRIRFDEGSGKFEVSENGGAWTQMVGVASPWTNTAGVVYPNNVTDDVVVGASAMVGSEKFRVVGDTSLQGDVIFEQGADRYVRMPQMPAGTLFANNIWIKAAQMGDQSGGSYGYAGDLYLEGGDGGSHTSVIPYYAGAVNISGGEGASTSGAGLQAGSGGAVGIVGGRGGDQSTTGDGGDGGNVLITGGQGRNPTGSGNPGVGGNVVLSGGPSTGGVSSWGKVIVGAGNTQSVELARSMTLTGTGHYIDFANDGYALFDERTVDPTTGIDQGALYTKDDGVGGTQLFYREDNGGPVHQLTPGSPWSESSSVVSTTNTSWDVVAGASAMSGVNSEKFRVVGDTSLSGGIYFETTDLGVTGFHDIEVNACTIAGQPGDGLRVTGATTAAATGAVLGGTGGYIRMRGGAGGTQNGTNNGGGGGQMQLYGGDGGNYIGTGTERGGSGGQAVFRAGDGGECTVSTTGDAGNGGITTVAGGDGGRSLTGNTGNCGDGGRLQLWGGSSGNDNGLDGIPGDGGDVWLQGGVGLTNGDGGDVQIRGGESFGGTHGGVRVGDLYTSSIQIGNGTDNPPTSFLGTGAVTFSGHQALVEQSSDPPNTGNQGKIYTKDNGAGVTELFYRASDGTIYQLTPTGQASSTSVQGATVYTCPSGLAVGDAVQITGADAVDEADASVPADRPVIGFVQAKPTATTCILHYYGDLGVFSGLTVGATYYLSDTTPGAITTTAPTTVGSIVQEVGFARNSTTLVVFIDPDFTQL